VVDAARREVALLIGAKDDEIVWTSGGTESDNWALLGVALAHLEEKGHFIVSSIEHHAVLEAATTLRELDFEVDLANCDSHGVVCVEEIERLIKPNTRLVSLMAVNNETGVTQPVEEVGALCRERGVLFHCDAVQTAGKVAIDVANWNVDLLSLSAHKINGPKGSGALYIRRGTTMRALQRGGGHERGRRGGTENVAGIVGFGAAAKKARENFEANEKYLRDLHAYMENALLELPGAIINGSEAARAPHITSVCLQGQRAETVAMNLDLRGIAVGTGSACSSGAAKPSHVLRAMGLEEEQARASLRISLGVQNTREEVDGLLDALRALVHGGVEEESLI
jgi:cysteine desulfurase